MQGGVRGCRCRIVTISSVSHIFSVVESERSDIGERNQGRGKTREFECNERLYLCDVWKSIAEDKKH